MRMTLTTGLRDLGGVVMSTKVYYILSLVAPVSLCPPTPERVCRIAIAYPISMSDTKWICFVVYVSEEFSSL